MCEVDEQNTSVKSVHKTSSSNPVKNRALDSAHEHSFSSFRIKVHVEISVGCI